MMIQEARWFAEKLAVLDPTQVFPMCNVGSSTDAFRTQDQPWVEELIFAPLRRAGKIVKHMDIKAERGVDIVGDFEDPMFLEKLAGMRFNSAFCSNLLEHVVQREGICQTLLSIIPSGGWLFISVPYKYPYHPDPIDTGFRPSTTELAALFPGTHMVYSAVVGGDRLLWLRRRQPVEFAFTLLRWALPFYKPAAWWRNKGYVPWLFCRLTASCVVLRKD
jgi:hypothetical protein